MLGLLVERQEKMVLISRPEQLVVHWDVLIQLHHQDCTSRVQQEDMYPHMNPQKGAIHVHTITNLYTLMLFSLRIQQVIEVAYPYPNQRICLLRQRLP